MTPAQSASDLSDDELEQQANYAHATRNWVFHHGTTDQFRHHTERMLELEQEYLRRHPQRTWQGTVDAPSEIDEATRLRLALRALSRQLDALLADPSEASDSDFAELASVRQLLSRVAHAGGRMHKLEIHQVARELGITPLGLASLYKGDGALLATDRDERVLTEAGRAASV
jgi:uncharacterized protein DUF6158